MAADILKTLLVNTVVFSVLFGAMLLVRKAFAKKMSAVLRYALWAVVVIKLVIPFGFESALSPLGWFSYPSAKAETSAVMERDIPVLQSTADKNTTYIANAALGTDADAYDAPQTVNIQAAEKTAVITLNWTEWVLIGWLAGVLAAALWLSFCKRRLKRRIIHSQTDVPENISAVFDECREELGIKRHICIQMQSAVSVPFIMGVIKPVLVLPDSIRGRNNNDLKHIFTHELVHYKHGDIIVIQAMNAIGCIYWFNPLILLCFSMIRSDMETICDQRCLKAVARDTHGYVETVLGFAGLTAENRRLHAAMSLNDGRSTMEKRIRDMFRTKKTGRRTRTLVGLIAALMLAACVLTACQPTPEKEVVVNKGNGAINSAIRQTAQVQAAYKAPATLKYSKKIENVTVNIDAAVSVPNAPSFGIYKVKLHDVQQDEADKYVKWILGNGPYYDAGLTKENYDEMIIKTKQSISDIKNMADDKFRSIYDADETKDSVIAALNSDISGYAKELESAPSSGDRRAADTKLVQNKDNKAEYDLQVFTDTDKGVAKASINRFTNNPSTVYTYELDAKSSGLTISEEQARSFASEFLKKLNLQDEYSIYNSQLVSSNIYSVKSGLILNRPESLSEKYYVFDFTRVRGGVPTNVIDGMPEMVTDATNTQPKGDEAYSYFPDQERMQMLVNDSGVISFYWRNHDDSAETTNENASLLPFDKIQDIIEGSSVYPKFFSSGDKNAELKITDIELGNMRVKSPDEQDRYLIIPVWDVIGKKVEPDSDSSKKGEMPEMSFLTINALDGSIIDRNKGY